MKNCLRCKIKYRGFLLYLWKADVLVLVQGGGVAALEDVVDGERGAAAVVDVTGVAHRLT